MSRRRAAALAAMIARGGTGAERASAAARQQGGAVRLETRADERPLVAFVVAYAGDVAIAEDGDGFWLAGGAVGARAVAVLARLCDYCRRFLDGLGPMRPALRWAFCYAVAYGLAHRYRVALAIDPPATRPDAGDGRALWLAEVGGQVAGALQLPELPQPRRLLGADPARVAAIARYRRMTWRDWEILGRVELAVYLAQVLPTECSP